MELANNKASNNQIRFTNNATTSLTVDSTNVYTPRQIQGDNGIKVTFIDTWTPTSDFEFRRNGIQFFRLDTALDNIVCSKGIVAGNGIFCHTYDSDGVSDVIFKKMIIHFVLYTELIIEFNLIDLSELLVVVVLLNVILLKAQIIVIWVLDKEDI